jgi:hypothetical protein
MSSIDIQVNDRYQAQDNGFDATERSMRRLFLLLLTIFLVILILVGSFTVYKSFKQKQCRLQLLRLTEGEVPQRLHEMEVLQNDRQVIMALGVVHRMEEQMKANARGRQEEVELSRLSSPSKASQQQML